MSPGSAAEALEMLESGMGYLYAGAAQMATETQAECLARLERLDAVETATRAAILGVFTASQGYTGDACYSERTWLRHRTRITKAAAAGHVGWARRAAAHPRVMAALAEGYIVSESYAREICRWTDRLPEDCRPAADAILISAAKAGMDLRDLAGLAAEMLERSRSDQPDGNRDGAFEDRGVRLETTFDGAGVLHGDLTPECAAVVQAVLDALSAPMGAEDDRTHAQRYHDALQEAMRRLVASGMLPERAGQPVKVWAHISLADLMKLEGSSALLEEWTAGARAAWAAARARASVGGGDGAAWLDGDAAAAMACDASIVPVVTGEVNLGALEELVRLCVELDRIRHADTSAAADRGPAGTGPSPAWEALEQAIIGQAVDLLSGPGGLASFLRRGLLGARLGGPSLPLDVGVSRDIPAAIRRAVILRDQHCQWTGGCDQPAAASEVHHVTHQADGGTTSVTGTKLYCWFHHHVVIHRMGWTVVVHPDGTTSAWSPDKTKVLHSHSPPPQAG
jgi:hypothetical protein